MKLFLEKNNFNLYVIDMRKTKNNKKDNDHINKILVFLGEIIFLMEK